MSYLLLNYDRAWLLVGFGMELHGWHSALSVSPPLTTCAADPVAGTKRPVLNLSEFSRCGLQSAAYSLAK